ncbi:unnamed protein product [Periconia digitata]|uniref:Uncharacterized protein n=1 Tax=Periconia digitata TaxID=1303443 RepID=A0A9W4UGA0_9PLEO|nr:unnamed protein product [Periconia digitata]
MVESGVDGVCGFTRFRISPGLLGCFRFPAVFPFRTTFCVLSKSCGSTLCIKARGTYSNLTRYTKRREFDLYKARFILGIVRFVPFSHDLDPMRVVNAVKLGRFQEPPCQEDGSYMIHLQFVELVTWASLNKR